MKTVLTFRDFTFRARHSLTGRSVAASYLHWHTYTVRFWFSGAPDQDFISVLIERKFASLHGNTLAIEPDSTDESLAGWFFVEANRMVEGMQCGECVRVRVTNDGQRGAEVCA